MLGKKALIFPIGDSRKRRSFPILTIALILANIIVFIYQIYQHPVELIRRFGFIPADPSLYSAFTSMFIHGDLGHLLGNLWYLWIFGDNVEDKLGKLKYMLLYLLAGFAAAFLHYITNLGSVVPAVGASGAISGILGAYLVMFPDVKINIWIRFGIAQIPAYILIGIWFIVQLIMGAYAFITSPGGGIAFFAHIGGFIFGSVVARIFNGRQA
jgi:membrane associated rhomboid family serine protease